jgi:hypothetical protein
MMARERRNVGGPSGATIAELMARLGHSTATVAMRYSTPRRNETVPSRTASEHS